MATYDAGDASINIRPSLKGFVTELEGELKKIDAQLGVAVHPDITRAKEELAAWRAQEERNSIDVPVNVDTNSVQRATREMGKLADAGKALSALKWNAGALGLGSLPAAATALANVAGAVQQISQAGLLLPGVMAAGAASIGTFKLGVVGVADAFEAVEKSADGSAKSIEAAQKALSGLAPSAAEAVKTAVEVKKELTEALQKPIQQKLFEGVSGDLRKLVDADLPVLQKGLTGIASGLNQNLRQLMASAGSESSQGILDRILGNTGDAQARLSKAIDPLVHGLGTLAAAGTDTLPRLADGVGRLAERFDKFISAADQDGRLAKWIDGGIKGVEHLGSIVLDLGKTFAGITQAAGGGEGLLSMLDAGAEKLSAFVNSAAGQEKLKTFFTEGREQLKRWFEILKNVGSTLGDVYNGAKQWADMLLPALQGITGVISAMPGGVTAVVTAFLAWKTAAGVLSLLSNLRSIGSELDALPGRASKSAKGVRSSFSGLKGAGAALGLGVALDGLNRDPDDKSVGTGLKTVGGAAVTGASVAGLPGFAVGTGVGIALDLYERNKQLQQRLAQLNQSLRDAGGDNQRVRELNNAFFGENIYDPGKLDDLVKPGTFARQGVIDEANRGAFSQYGVDGGNIEATLDKVVANAKLAKQSIDQLGDAVTTLPSGEVVLKDPTRELIDRVRVLGLDIKTLPNGEVAIDVNTDVADNKMRAFIAQWSKTIISPTVVPGTPGATQQPTVAGVPFPGFKPKKDGGEIWGGVAGRDSVPLMGMPGEHMLTTDDVSAMGGQGNVYAFRRALHSGRVRGYAGGGAVVDEFGNPVNAGAAPGPAGPIAPNPLQGGGLPGILGSVLSGIQGPMNLVSGLANLAVPAGADTGIPGLQTQHGAGTIVPGGGDKPLSLADRAAGIPGLWGLVGSMGSSDPAKNVMSWGEQTGQWLGNFTARTVGSFATSLWKGALGIVGLENSILSPDNPWNQAGQSVGQFAFGSEGPLGKLLGANPGAGAAGSDSGKQKDPKKIREAQQKVSDKQKAVEEQRARMAEMPANASQSTRMARQNALDKAIREADDAQADLTTLFSGSSASGGGTSGLAYPVGGTGSEQWRPTVRQVLATYGPSYGITASNFQSWEDALVRQISTESGGNPNSVNANDSNGRGGTQRVAGILNFLQSTFESHNITGGDYMDPGSQIAAALPYVAKRWGVDETGAPLQIGRGQGFAFGGGVRGPGGPKGDQIPALLSDNEHVLTAEDVDAMGGQSAVYAFRGALHRAPGGEVSLALLRNPTPPPRPQIPDIKPMTPRPAAGAAPTPAPAPVPAPAAPAAPAPPAPGPQTPPPAAAAPAHGQGPGFAPAGSAAAPSSSGIDHNLPAINTAIDSTASTLGNLASSAMSMGAAGGSGGAGALGGGLASSMVSGLFQQGGKIAKNVVNVFSSALVGNLGDNTTAGAYGAPVLSAPPQTARSIDARTVFGDVSTNDPRDFYDKQVLFEQQRTQTMTDFI